MVTVEAAPYKAAAVWPPTTHHETIKIRRTRHVGHCWRSSDVDPFTWPRKGRTICSNLHTAALCPYGM